MAENTEQDHKVSYKLMERVTDLLICSRCFRRNVRRKIILHLSSRKRPMPMCDECSGRIKPGHTAQIVRLG
jgi:hypothetical protein